MKKLTVKEIVRFSVLGTLMYASKIIMELIPNVHLVGVLTVAITVVYRKKALYPIYTYVLMCGLFSGFATWWLPHLYLWLVLWAGVMLLPQNINPKVRPLVYMCVCALHGFLYGILYSPAQALVFGLSSKGTLAWIAAGIPWDVVHGISNFFCGVLICPIIAVLKRDNI